MTDPDPRTLRQFFYVAIAITLATLVFYVFGEDLGDASAVASIVPIALVAAFFGTRPGLVATTLAFPFNTFVLDYISGVHTEAGPITRARTLITLSLIVVSFVFGRYHVLTGRISDLEASEAQTKETAEHAEFRLRALLAAVPDPIFRLSRSGRLLEVHGPTATLDMGDYLFRNFNEFLPEALAIRMGAAIRSVLATGNTEIVRGKVDLGEGVQTYEISLSRAESEIIGIARDVTKVRKADKKAGQVDPVGTRDEFVASLAHELRTPLSAVVGFSHELRDDPQRFSDAERAELIHTIADQSQLLMYRIEDLIVGATAGIGRVAFTSDIFDVNQLARKVIKELPATHVRIIGEATMARGDQVRSAQVIRNLVGNAVRHGGDVFVTIESMISAVHVSVNDDGPGAGLENPEDVFEPYRTSAEAETQPDRLGIGLVVARQLARLMEGEVIYERKNGLSSFTFSLPKAP